VSFRNAEAKVLACKVMFGIGFAYWDLTNEGAFKGRLTLEGDVKEDTCWNAELNPPIGARIRRSDRFAALLDLSKTTLHLPL